MIRIFIGFDRAETVAYHVLAHSILARSSSPVAITPLYRNTMHSCFYRPRGEHDSTEFSMSRFMVPYLCNYEGTAIFMDCDMLMLGDVAELLYESRRTDAKTKVGVVKHDYVPRQSVKFLGAQQTKYGRKNWSSLMVFNCANCKELSPQYVNNAPGLDLHQFKWCVPEEIYELPKAWNYLVGEDNQCEPHEAKLVHYTNGTPCFFDYADCEFSDEWRSEYDKLRKPMP